MLLQIALTSLLTLTVVVATPPPGYQANDHQRTKHDQTEPKYKYSYKIIGEKGSQEKQEQREGIYALGRYYVQGVGSKQTVEYLADDWGYHPFIEYSNVSPHSKSSTQIAFGEEAVKALQNSQKNQNPTPIKTSFQQASQTGTQQLKTSYLPSNNNYQRAPGSQQNGNKAVNSYANFQGNQNQQQTYKSVNQAQRQEINHQQQTLNLKPTVSYYTNHPQPHGSNHNQQQAVNPVKTFSYYTRHQKPQQQGQAKLNLHQQQFGNHKQHSSNQKQQFGNQQQQFGNQQQHLSNQKQQFSNQQQFGNQKQQFANLQVKGQVVTAVPTVSYYTGHQQTQVGQNFGNVNQQGQDYYSNQAKAQQVVQEEAAVNEQQQKVKEVSVNSNQQIQEQVSLNNHQEVSNQVTLNQQINNQVVPTVSYYANQQNPQVTLTSHQEQVVGTVPTIEYYSNANKEQQLVQEINKNQQQLSVNNHQIQGNAQAGSYLNNLPKAQQLIQHEGSVNSNQQQKIKEVNDHQQQQIQEQIAINKQQQKHLQEQVILNQQQQLTLNNLVLPTVSYYLSQQNPQVTVSSHQEQIVGTVPTIDYYANANKEQQLVKEINKNQQQLSLNSHQIEGTAPTVNYLNNLPKVQEQVLVNSNEQQKIKEVSDQQQQQKLIQEQAVLNDHQQQVQTVSIAPIVNYYTNHPEFNQAVVSNNQHQQLSLGNQLQELGAAISYYSNQQKIQKGDNHVDNYYNSVPKAEQLVQEQVINKEEQKIVQEVNHEQKIQEPVIPTISYYTNLLKAQQLKEEVEGSNNQQQEIHEQIISTVLPTLGYSKPQTNENQHVSYTSNQPIAQQLVQEHASVNQIQEVKEDKANSQLVQEQVTSKGGLYTNIHQGSANAAATTTGSYGSKITESKQQIKPLYNYFTSHQQTQEHVTFNKQQGQGVNGQGAVSYFSYHKKPQQLLQVAVNTNQKEESQTDKPAISYYTNHHLQQGNDQFTTNQLAYFGHLQQPQENVVVIPTQSEIYGASPVHNVLLVNNAHSLSGPISYYNKVTHSEILNNDAYENAYPHPGLYGTKINAKEQLITKEKDLVESTRNFVTGQDVLNINNVLSLETHQNSSELPSESTTPTTLQITEKYVEGSLTKDPIVVADLEENNLSSESGYFSSTERSSFQVTQPTLVITPRPVSKQFLAPINAGVQLQSAKDKTNDAKLVIDIQKSVPYYLGNYQSKITSDNKAEAQNNVDLVQYSLPTPEALVQLKNHVESNDLIQKTDAEGQFDYQKQQKLVVTDNVEQTYLKNLESNQTVNKIPEESFGGTGLALNVLLPNHQLNHLQLPQLYQQTNFANIFALPPIPNIHHPQQQLPQENNNIVLSSYAPNYPPCDNQKAAIKTPATFYLPQKYPVQTYTDLKPPKPVYGQQKQRNARQSFKQNVRLEYGFMPPLIPSTEIDENGKPIEKSDN